MKTILNKFKNERQRSKRYNIELSEEQCFKMRKKPKKSTTCVTEVMTNSSCDQSRHGIPGDEAVEIDEDLLEPMSEQRDEFNIDEVDFELDEEDGVEPEVPVIDLMMSRQATIQVKILDFVQTFQHLKSLAGVIKQFV